MSKDTLKKPIVYEKKRPGRPVSSKTKQAVENAQEELTKTPKTDLVDLSKDLFGIMLMEVQ